MRRLLVLQRALRSPRARIAAPAATEAAHPHGTTSPTARNGNYRRRRQSLAVGLLVTALAVAAGSAFVRSQAATAGQLPGEQTWGSGVSSYIFGTNSTIDYGSPNVNTLSSVQGWLKQGGLTLMRTWAYDGPVGVDTYSDAEITGRVQAIQNAGMQCMFMLGSVDDLTWLKHVVTLLGSSCNIYEFGNENDNYNGLGIATVVTDWNAAIPALRAINPNAVFGGPAVMYPTSSDSSQVGYSNDIQYFLGKTAASGVRANFITYHDYPCNGYTDKAACLTHTPQAYAGDQSEVLSWEQQYYGNTVPTGITEYNFDPGSSTLGAWANDTNFMFQWTETAINAFIANHFAFATQFTSLNYSGYGALDMFDDSTYAPKAQFYGVVDMVERNGGPSTLPIPSSYPSATPTPNPTATPNPTSNPTATPTPTPGPSTAGMLVGNGNMQGMIDSNPIGCAQAYPYVAGTSGTVGFLSLYLDGSNTASKATVGLYSDAGGTPGTLLTSGQLTSPKAGSWNMFAVPTTNVTAGTNYWLAILQPTGSAGTIEYRDNAGTGSPAPVSQSTTLSGLGTQWSSGNVWPGGPASAYAVIANGPDPTSPTPTPVPSSTATPTPSPTATPSPTSSPAPSTGMLIGTNGVQAQLDSNPIGSAQAYPYSARSSGTVRKLSVFLDSSSTASAVTLGLYSDNSGAPGKLLTAGTITGLHAGSWNSVSVSHINVTSGTKYWIAILQPGGSTGTIEYRDNAGSGTVAPMSASTSLSSLPSTWSNGQVWLGGPASAYAS